MKRMFAIYVGSKAQRNLEIGLANLTWGWKDSALRPARRQQVAESIKPGDVLVMGAGGPTPRVPHGGWAQARMKRTLFLRVVTSLSRNTTELWPDETYPNRLRFEVLREAGAEDPGGVDADILEALRWSANTQGVAVLVGDARSHGCDI